MARKIAVLIVLMLTAFCLPAAAGAQGDPARHVDQARAALKQNLLVEALKELDLATAALWRIMPLSIKTAVLVDTPAGGYGEFTPRANNRYRSGERIRMYVELVGYKMALRGGKYHLDLDGEIYLLNADGSKVIWQKLNYLRIRQQLGFKTRDYFLNLSLRTTAPPGQYIVRLLFIDRIGETKVRADFPVRLLKAPAPPGKGS